MCGRNYIRFQGSSLWNKVYKKFKFTAIFNAWSFVYVFFLRHVFPETL